MLSAALGGTVALIVFSLIAVAFLVLCCVLSFTIFQDTVEEIENDIEAERREPPPPVLLTPLFEQPVPGQPKE
jgi:uncharacterized membrane protein YqjE